MIIMNYKDVFERILKNKIIERLEILEKKYSNYTVVLEDCNFTLHSILEKKVEFKSKIKKERSQDHKENDSIQMKYSSLTEINFRRKNSEFNEKTRKKSFIIPEKSVTELKAKYYKEGRKVVRSNTKPNIKSKDFNNLKETPQSKIKKESIKPSKGFLKPKPVLKNSNLNKTFNQANTINKFSSPLKSNNESLKKKGNKVLYTDESKKSTKSKNSKIINIFQTEEKLDNNARNTHLSGKTTEFNDCEYNSNKENNFVNNNDKSPKKINIQKVYDGNLERKNDKLNQPEDMNELLRNHFSSILKFLDKSNMLKLRLNKNWNKMILKSLVSHKKDELILNERDLQYLREKYSMDDLMKEAEQFSISPSTKLTLERIENMNSIELDSENLPENRVLILYQAFFQAIKISINKGSNQELWKECCNYFRVKSIRELIKNFSESLDFSEGNILKLSKILYNEKIFESNLVKENPLNDLLLQLLKDIYGYLGLFSSNENNACILFSFYRYKFENISQTIDTLKKMENKIRKN